MRAGRAERRVTNVPEVAWNAARSLGGVMSVVLLGCVLAGCGSGDEGEVVQMASPREVAGSTFEFVVPSGTLNVTVGDPVEKVPDSDLADKDQAKPRGGDVFVPMSVEFDDRGSIGTQLFHRGLGDDDYAVSLLADGDALPVGQMTSRSFYVRIPESKSSALGAEVDFQGVAQREYVDGDRDDGDAAALYGYPDTVEKALCRDGWKAVASKPEVKAAVDCDVSAVAYPYAPGAGWASDKEPGAMWAVIEASTVLQSLEVVQGGDPQACAEVEGAGSNVTVDGREPAAVDRDEDVVKLNPMYASEVASVLVDDPVAEHTVRIERTWRCLIGNKSEKITMAWEKSVKLQTGRSE